MRENKGQTTIDLALAVFFFLGAVLIIVGVGSTVFFADGVDRTDKTPTADIIQQELTQDILTTERNTELSPTEVEAFFTPDDPINNSTNPFSIQLDDNIEAQITIEATETTPPILEDEFENGELTRGDEPGPARTSVEQRAVLDGNPVVITVTVWVQPE